jgi:hypothetical protein
MNRNVETRMRMTGTDGGVTDGIIQSDRSVTGKPAALNDPGGNKRVTRK